MFDISFQKCGANVIIKIRICKFFLKKIAKKYGRISPGRILSLSKEVDIQMDVSNSLRNLTSFSK